MVKTQFKKKIAVVRLWPELKNAESEVTERIIKASKMIGIDCLVIDPQGKCVESGKIITNEDVDFAIHLHFYTPKSYDIFSFVALWNPTQFFHEWGYRHFSRNLLTHDDFLSCDSIVADDHVNRLIANDASHFSPHFRFYHSLSDPIHTPKKMQRRLFYIGINWEKLGKTSKSRHHKLLTDLDSTGKLLIFGPKIFQNVDVWEDFESYEDEIPFDGESIIHKISEIGVGLVLSSQAHIDSGLMSNRLFETLAAGAVAICDENPFTRRFFGETVLYVNSKSETLSQEVIAHLDWLNENPDKAKLLAEKSQRIFKDHFILHKSIQTIYDHLESRKHELNESVVKSKTSPMVGTIFMLLDTKEDSVESFIKLSHKQSYRKQSVVCLYDQDDDIAEIKNRSDKVKNLKVSWVGIKDLKTEASLRLGRLIQQGVESLMIQTPETQFLTIMFSNEYIYHDHISTLIRLATLNPHLRTFASSAIVLNHEINDNYYYIQDEEGRTVSNTSIPQGFARYLFEIGNFRAVTQFSLPYLNHRFPAQLTHGIHIPVAQKVTSEIRYEQELYTRANETLAEENEILTDVLGVQFHRHAAWQLESFGLAPTRRRRFLVRLRNEIVKSDLNPNLRRMMRSIYWFLIK